MVISTLSTPLSANHRLGLHYFPDTLHYREADLQTWLPELQALGVSWLVLRSEQDRAIPEHFLRGLKQAGIRPLIQFTFSLERMPDLKEIGTLWEVYARWGAGHVIFYDRPNTRAAWPVAGWVQQDLVERFLDRYLPAANQAQGLGLTPVFPPLQPGGSYWDTAFLRSALQGMQRRKQEALLQNLVLGAYAWTFNRSLDWGAGGPERWPLARPYVTPAGSQDQRGFRIFDWYAAVAGSVLHTPCPVILFQAGLPGDPAGGAQSSANSAETFAACTAIARLLAGEKVQDPFGQCEALQPVPAQVLACNFWLLGADPGSPFYAQAWLEGKGKRRKVAEAIRAWRREAARERLCAQERMVTGPLGAQVPVSGKQPGQAADLPRHAIQHYLLLPGYEWGVSDWYLEVIRPFVKKYRPTIGFSPEEAAKAARVTVVGNPQNYPEDLLSRLQKSGCFIEQISGDGTNIASELAER